MTNQSKIQERVDRERAAHTEDDVLARAFKLKDRFPHIWKYLSLQDVYAQVDKYVDQSKGKRVLDLGCGNGERSLELLKAGAIITGIDISAVYISNCVRLAREANFAEDRIDFQTMDAHNLTFESEVFDLVIGSGILHHLDLERSTEEILRVLKPRGRAVFLEPLSANPLLKVLRFLTPKARTVDEQPLSRKDLKRFQNHPHWCVESSYCGLIEAPTAVLTSIILRPYEHNKLLRIAHWFERIANSVPWIRPMNQYVLLNLVRK